MLPFLDRGPELSRLNRAFGAKRGSLCVVFGRRRVGKSRLVQEALRGRKAVYYVGDDRDAAVQRAALAVEVGRLIPGFEQVTYPSWEALLDRFGRQAPKGSVLAIDELPSLVVRSKELPSLLQKHVDGELGARHHTVLLGSSQQMMHGLVLDASAPLFGRAEEILRITPLDVSWVRRGTGVKAARDVVATWATFGGVPRYWELARRFATTREAFRDLALDPLGVLYQEPDRLLRDDLDDVARAASILTLIAAGAHRPSEIAARLGAPVTTLSRPLSRLVDLGLVRREVSFGESARDSKRALYRVADPFLRTWYRFVEPNRSQLEAGALPLVESAVDARWPAHLGEAWEELARSTLPMVELLGRRWGVGQRFWGKDSRGAQVEIDVVATAVDDLEVVLVGEVKHRLQGGEVDRALADLRERAERTPALSGRKIHAALWVLEGKGKAHDAVVRANEWLGAVEG